MVTRSKDIGVQRKILTVTARIKFIDLKAVFMFRARFRTDIVCLRLVCHHYHHLGCLKPASMRSQCMSHIDLLHVGVSCISENIDSSGSLHLPWKVKCTEQ